MRRFDVGRSPSVTIVGTFLSMHLSTSEASASSQPPTTITPAGFCVHSASTVVMKAARSTEVGPAMRTLTFSALRADFEARIDALDEERQVRGVADPDIFLVAAARVADRNVEPGRLFGQGRRCAAIVSERKCAKQRFVS